MWDIQQKESILILLNTMWRKRQWVGHNDCKAHCYWIRLVTYTMYRTQWLEGRRRVSRTQWGRCVDVEVTAPPANHSLSLPAADTALCTYMHFNEHNSQLPGGRLSGVSTLCSLYSLHLCRNWREGEFYCISSRQLEGIVNSSTRAEGSLTLVTLWNR